MPKVVVVSSRVVPSSASVLRSRYRNGVWSDQRLGLPTVSHCVARWPGRMSCRSSVDAVVATSDPSAAMTVLVRTSSRLEGFACHGSFSQAWRSASVKKWASITASHWTTASSAETCGVEILMPPSSLKCVYVVVIRRTLR